MFCDRCGAENKDTASFCRKCGQAFDTSEVETRVASRGRELGRSVVAPVEARNVDRSEDNELFTITPTLMFVKAGYVLAAIGGLLLVALTAGLTNIPISFCDSPRPSAVAGARVLPYPPKAHAVHALGD